MKITAAGPAGATVAFYRNGQVYGGQTVDWPDDRPPPPWSVEGQKARRPTHGHEEKGPPAEAKAPGEEIVLSLSSLGDRSDDELRAFIAERSETKPKGLHLMGRAKLIELAGRLGTEGEQP